MPGWLPQWHCGVRAKQSGRLLAFIAAVPQTIRVYDKERPMVEINFLCVHKKLRSKRVAPVLIREITRRVNQQKIFQAVYTAGVVLPKPVAVCRYWHRSLNPKKLIDVKFSHLSAKMTMARTIKLYKLPDAPITSALRPLEKKDVSSAWKLLSEYLKQFSLAPVFTKKEFEHVFTPIEDVVYTYVVETGGKVTDMLSFYSLPSSVMQHPVHKSIRAVYSFYNVATTVSFKQLMNDALIIAHKLGFDVFNALDLMQNASILEDLKFGIGDEVVPSISSLAAL
ncbi:Myristoyl-CoA:protein N-myristoyltransferase domain protein [Cooperia oncophora]